MHETKVTTQDSSFRFTIRIVKLYQYLTNEKKEYFLRKQLLLSGIAVGTLVREAQNAESKLDFIHTLGVAQKECDESIFLARIIERNKFLKGK